MTFNNFIRYARENRESHDYSDACSSIHFADMALGSAEKVGSPNEAFWEVCDAICELTAWLDAHTSEPEEVLESYIKSRAIQRSLKKE